MDLDHEFDLTPPAGLIAFPVLRSNARAAVRIALLATALVPGRGPAQENVRVLNKAEPQGSSCSLVVYRSETEITDRFVSLCELDISKTTVFTGVDMTGSALSATRVRACGCGANAVILHSNSSEADEMTEVVETRRNYSGTYKSTVKRFRPSEQVRATAILVSGTPPAPSGPRPPNRLRPGFRNVSWGAPIDASYGRDAPSEGSTRTPTYRRTADSLLVGGVRARTIQFLAPNDVVAAVRIVFEPAAWLSIKPLLDQDWGKPQRCSSERSRCIWRNGAPADAETVAVLTQKPNEVELLIANPLLFLEGRDPLGPARVRPRVGIQDDPGMVAPAADAAPDPTRGGLSRRLPHGFLDVTWGAPPFLDARLVSRDDGKECFERSSDGNLKRALGATQVTWCFVEGAFYDAVAVLPAQAAERFVTRYSELWGEPRREGESTVWQAEDGSTIVRLDPASTPDGDWRLYSFDALYLRRKIAVE